MFRGLHCCENIGNFKTITANSYGLVNNYKKHYNYLFLPYLERIPCPKVDCGDPNCYALPAGYDGCAGPCICPRSATCQVSEMAIEK